LNYIKYFEPTNHVKKIRTLSFDERYNELLAYKEKYNSINVSRHDKEHKKLYHWLTHIKRSRILTADQKAKLKALGLEVKISKNSNEFSRTFDKRFEELKEYKLKFGTAHIKRTNAEYQNLYYWTSYIKRRALLTREQIEKLKSIDFDTSNIESYLESE
jgi:hypothetical protein